MSIISAVISKVGDITPLGAVDGCKRALENCTGAGCTGGALHDSQITYQLTQRLHRSLGYVITTVSKIRSISCNGRLFSQMYEQNNEEFNRLLMHTGVRWLLKGACLSRFCDLFETILEFFDNKEPSLRELGKVQK
ncbi:putative zinc finger protein [Trichinella spiralis]|uniref:putative zinc finger protein n=1 Tax=Trichinella spiralis TaxID=6334 RepID=UPI0001EFD875|nr:putative zinc finger protein [Trichinella spiralis]